MRIPFDVTHYAHPVNMMPYVSNCWICGTLTFYHVYADLIRNRLTDTLRSERQDKKFIETAKALTAFGIHRMEKGRHDRSRSV